MVTLYESNLSSNAKDLIKDLIHEERSVLRSLIADGDDVDNNIERYNELSDLLELPHWR